MTDLCENHANAVLAEYPDARMGAFTITAPCGRCAWCVVAQNRRIAEAEHEARAIRAAEDTQRVDLPKT